MVAADHVLRRMRQPSLFQEPSADPAADTWPAGTVFTIGHSTHPIDEFIRLLRGPGIELLVDVRSVPRSRHNPQFNSETLARSLAAAGIDYRHIKPLGGLRHRPKDAPPLPNGLWENEAFGAFADYAMTPAFKAGFEELSALADERRAAIMCAEALWWRCHRRLIADRLLAAGRPVAHVLGNGKVEAARLTQGAVVDPGSKVTYPALAP